MCYSYFFMLISFGMFYSKYRYEQQKKKKGQQKKSAGECLLFVNFVISINFMHKILSFNT